MANGYPVIALGIIGPPEPCIVAGFDADGDVVMGWNFFQNAPEFSDAVNIMDNGYFKCRTWWENTDTQAVMCIGEKKDIPYTDKEIVKMALRIMEPRQENTYIKGTRAYQAWKDMLLQEKWFENGSTFDKLFSMILVQNDAMTCIHDGRQGRLFLCLVTILTKGVSDSETGQAEAQHCNKSQNIHMAQPSFQEIMDFFRFPCGFPMYRRYIVNGGSQSLRRGLTAYHHW